MSKTTILLVDDHQVVLEGISAVLSKSDDLEIVGSCINGREALRKVKSKRPDIVIMDISMPQFNGIEATFQIKKINETTKIIIFTMHSYREFLLDLMKAGISAYVNKQRPISDLHLAVQVVRSGGNYFSEDAPSFIANHVESLSSGEAEKNPFELLSPREREIFQMLAEGVSIKETAEMLCISPKTVEAHKYHIMEKLQIRSMTEWTKEAIRRKIVQL